MYFIIPQRASLGPQESSRTAPIGSAIRQWLRKTTKRLLDTAITVSAWPANLVIPPYRPVVHDTSSPWDPEYSAELDSYVLYRDAIDDLKRLFTTGAVEVRHE
jgi:hypothetical protein